MLNDKAKQVLSELMASLPNKHSKISPKRRDMQILRAAIIAEYDAVNLYEQFAEAATNPDLKKLMLEVANEEKVHVGEFEEMLERLDPEHEDNVEEGEDEVKELLGDK